MKERSWSIADRDARSSQRRGAPPLSEGGGHDKNAFERGPGPPTFPSGERRRSFPNRNMSWTRRPRSYQPQTDAQSYRTAMHPPPPQPTLPPPPLPPLPVYSEAYVLTPWTDSMPERDYPTMEQRLHHEIVAFVAYMQPTPAETRVRRAIAERVQSVVDGWHPGAQVHVFGSSATGLCLPTSDVDLAVSAPIQNTKKGLFQLAGLLRSSVLTNKVRVIHRARVPILDFVTYPEYGSLHVDLGINNMDGVDIIDVIKQFLEAMPALKPLVLLIKAFLLQRRLNDASQGGLGSYAVFCLCASFLQVNPGKRPQDYLSAPMESESLGYLLVDFMQYYGLQFRYDEWYISVAEGQVLDKMLSPWWDPKQPDRLSIQCLIHPENDIARSAHNTRAIRRAFKEGYVALFQLNSVDRNLLGSVVAVNEKMVRHRERLRDAARGEQDVSRSSSGPLTQILIALPLASNA